MEVNENHPPPAFTRFFLEAVDEGLSCLGESGKQAVYFHLEKRGIKKREIASRIEGFADALEKIFGYSGARLLEIQIMKSLYRKIGRPLKWNERQDLTFTEYVATAKRTLNE